MTLATDVQPFEEIHWNLLQVLAWIYTGDRTAVAECSAAVTDHGSIWQQLMLPDGRQELVNTPAERPGFISLYVRASWNGGAATKTFADARREFLTALESENLIAMGVRNGQGEVQKIDPMTLYDAEIWEVRGAPEIGPRRYHQSGATRWSQVRMRRDAVLAVWPDPLACVDEERLEVPLPSDFVAHLRRDFQVTPLEEERTAFVNQLQALDWIRRQCCGHLLNNDAGFERSSAEKEAEVLYRTALQRGQVAAVGKLIRDGSAFDPMPKTFWIDAVIDRTWAYRPLPSAALQPDTKHGGWEVRLSKDDVVRLWPADGTTLREFTEPTDRIARCEVWLRQPPQVSQLRKSLTVDAATAIPGLLTREFDIAYKSVHGRSRGRPKQIKSAN